MESFSIQCTTCRTRLKVRSEEALGKILGCPKCGGMVHVPTDLASLRAASAASDSASGETSVVVPSPPTSTPATVPTPAAPGALIDNDFDVVNDLLAEGLAEPPVAASPVAAPPPAAPPRGAEVRADVPAQAATPAPAAPSSESPSPAPPREGPAARHKAAPPAGESRRGPAASRPHAPAKGDGSAVADAANPVAPPGPAGKSAIQKGARASADSGAVAAAATTRPAEAAQPPLPNSGDAPAEPPLASAAHAMPPPEPATDGESQLPVESTPLVPAPGWVSPTVQKWRTIAIYAAAGIGGVVLAIVLLLLLISSFAKPEVAVAPPSAPPPAEPSSPPTPEPAPREQPAPPTAEPMTPRPPDDPPPPMPAPPALPPTVEPMPPVAPAEPAPLPVEPATPMPAEPAPEVPPLAEIPPTPKPPERAELPKLDVAARLNDPIAGLQLPAIPLIDFVDFVGEFSTLPIGLDPPGLRMAGANVRTPVTVDVVDTTVQGLLDQVAARLQLNVQRGERQLTLTHSWLLETAPRKVEHDVADLTNGDPAAVAELRELALRFAAPHLAEGGPDAGQVATSGARIAVTQPMAVQIELLRFFERLRLARGKPAKNNLVKTHPRLFRLDPPDWSGAKLATPINLNFVQRTRLAQVLTRLRAVSGVAVLADWTALADERLDPHSEATLSTDGTPLTGALDQLAAQLSLAWRLVDDETVQLTTLAAATRFDREATVEFRQVSALAKDADAATALLARLEEAFAEADAPIDANGFLHVDLPSGYLLARLSRAQHARLADWLAEWSSATPDE